MTVKIWEIASCGHLSDDFFYQFLVSIYICYLHYSLFSMQSWQTIVILNMCTATKKCQEMSNKWHVHACRYILQINMHMVMEWAEFLFLLQIMTSLTSTIFFITIDFI